MSAKSGFKNDIIHSMNDKILIILTGGRIDSIWNGKVDEIIVSPHSLIPEYFNNNNIYGEVEFEEICMKDSRALTPQDRESILRVIEESSISKILITHGTHTMPDTLKYIKHNLKNSNKTIVFTGAVTPLKDFAFSDAAFNLGYGLAKVQELKPGIYICMAGKTLTSDQIEQDLNEGKFYAFFPEKQ